MAGVFEVDDEFKTEDGDYVFPNITQANSQYADEDGVEYYCTATNDFGTIRSPTVRAFYAGMPTPLCYSWNAKTRIFNYLPQLS